MKEYKLLENCDVVIRQDNYDNLVIFSLRAWEEDVREFRVVYERAGFGVGTIKLRGCTKDDIDSLLYKVYYAAYKKGFSKMSGDIEEMIGKYSK